MAELINMERIDFINRLKQGDKTDCPCCGRHAQMYRRSAGDGRPQENKRALEADGKRNRLCQMPGYNPPNGSCFR